MKKYKVEGWIKVPVDVEIWADSKEDAVDFATQAVSDEIAPGSNIYYGDKIDHQFDGEDEINTIKVCDGYEYDFSSAEEISA